MKTKKPMTGQGATHCKTCDKATVSRITINGKKATRRCAVCNNKK